jgi:hypothetical protein
MAYSSGNTWTLQLTNNLPAHGGIYSVWVKASSASAPLRVLYDYVPLNIEINPPHGWACGWGSFNSDEVHSLGVDNGGNVYVTGLFNEEVDFDPGPGNDYRASNGNADVFLGKFNQHGNLQWVRNWGSIYDDRGYALAVDNMDNVYATGYYRYTADFHPGPPFDWHDSMGEEDAYLCKYDWAGDFKWARTWGGDSADMGLDTAVADDGSVYVTGYFMGTVDFHPHPLLEEVRTSNGGSDVFLSKFNSSGDFIWVRTWGGNGYGDEGRAVTVDSMGNVYVCGNFTYEVDFDPDPVTEFKLKSAGGFDAFICKYTPSGSFVWAGRWGGVDNDAALGLARDSMDRVYVTGYFLGSVDFDPGPGSHYLGGTSITWDAYLCRFNTNRTLSWAISWGGDMDDYGRDVAVDGGGNIYVTGDFNGAAYFSSDPDAMRFNSNGDSDAFLCTFDPSGSLRWARTWGGSGGDYGQAVAADSLGNSYVGGNFRLTVDFDPGPGRMRIKSNGVYDAFLTTFQSGG